MAVCILVHSHDQQAGGVHVQSVDGGRCWVDRLRAGFQTILMLFRTTRYTE